MTKGEIASIIRYYTGRPEAAADALMDLFRSELAAQKDGWQPIETAPKDEFPVVVYCPDNHESESIMLAERDRLVWRVYIGGQRINPSHWMQLPEPPRDEQGSA